MLSKVIDRTDRISYTSLFLINICLALFVFLANSSVFMDGDLFGQDRQRELFFLNVFCLVLSMIIFFTSGVFFLKKELKKSMLSVHALIFVIGSLAGGYYIFSLIVNGLPEDTFSWIGGLFTFLCIYSTYLLRRTFFEKQISKYKIIKYLHLIILIFAAFLEYCILNLADAGLAEYQQNNNNTNNVSKTE